MYKYSEEKNDGSTYNDMETFEAEKVLDDSVLLQIPFVGFDYTEQYHNDVNTLHALEGGVRNDDCSFSFWRLYNSLFYGEKFSILKARVFWLKEHYISHFLSTFLLVDRTKEIKIDETDWNLVEFCNNFVVGPRVVIEIKPEKFGELMGYILDRLEDISPDDSSFGGVYSETKKQEFAEYLRDKDFYHLEYCGYFSDMLNNCMEAIIGRDDLDDVFYECFHSGEAYEACRAGCLDEDAKASLKMIMDSLRFFGDDSTVSELESFLRRDLIAFASKFPDMTSHQAYDFDVRFPISHNSYGGGKTYFVPDEKAEVYVRITRTVKLDNFVTHFANRCIGAIIVEHPFLIPGTILPVDELCRPIAEKFTINTKREEILHITDLSPDPDFDPDGTFWQGCWDVEGRR